MSSAVEPLHHPAAVDAKCPADQRYMPVGSLPSRSRSPSISSTRESEDLAEAIIRAPSHAEVGELQEAINDHARQAEMRHVAAPGRRGLGRGALDARGSTFFCWPVGDEIT